jgi:hypothetical protein
MCHPILVSRKLIVAIGDCIQNPPEHSAGLWLAIAGYEETRTSLGVGNSSHGHDVSVRL